MEVITEAELRTARISEMGNEYHVPEGTYVTAPAKEYLRDRKIRLVYDTKQSAVMSRTEVRKQGDYTYIHAETGAGYRDKPEEMTHLRGNLLVAKTHPRIALRGKLDALSADILLLQSDKLTGEGLRRDLNEVLGCVRAVLGAEVKDMVLGEVQLFGMTSEELREVSHYVREHFGMDHPIPDYTMGETALMLNLLRTKVREAELKAAEVFAGGDSQGIIKCLNRLSSGVYILFCRVLSGYYGEKNAGKKAADQAGGNL